jgi:hypothetical protein
MTRLVISLTGFFAAMSMNAAAIASTQTTTAAAKKQTETEIVVAQDGTKSCSCVREQRGHIDGQKVLGVTVPGEPGQRKDYKQAIYYGATYIPFSSDHRPLKTEDWRCTKPYPDSCAASNINVSCTKDAPSIWMACGNTGDRPSSKGFGSVVRDP